MKTELYCIPDWKEICSKIGYPDAPTQFNVEEMVKLDLTRGFVTFVELPKGTAIKKEHRVTIKTVSNLKKYNREKTVLIVGGNLYDKTVEALLVGMCVGEEGHAVIHGEEVTFLVLKVEEKSYPELTDPMAEAMQVEGIKTLASYQEYVKDKLRNEYAADLCKKILEVLKETCEMSEIAREDINQVIDCEYAPLNMRFSLETMSEQEWEEAFGKESLREFYEQIYPDVAVLFGTTSKASFYESRQEAAKEMIQNCLLLRAILKEQGEDTDPTMVRSAWEKLMNKMKKEIINYVYGGH